MVFVSDRFLMGLYVISLRLSIVDNYDGRKDKKNRVQKIMSCDIGRRIGRFGKKDSETMRARMSNNYQGTGETDL